MSNNSNKKSKNAKFNLDQMDSSIKKCNQKSNFFDAWMDDFLSDKKPPKNNNKNNNKKKN